MSGVLRLGHLATERTAAGHSLTSLAKVANVSDRTVQNLENGGSDNTEICQRLANALGVTLETLGAEEL